MLPPCLTAAFGASHDEAVLSCLSDLLGAAPLPDTAARLAQLPFHEGGLGLRSAVSLAPSAFWGYWADVLPVLHSQVPDLAAFVLRLLQAPGPVPARRCHALLLAQAQLAEAGFAGPSWEALLQPGADPPPFAHALDHVGPTLRGWQSPAAEAVSRQLQAEVLAQTDPASQALLFSQTGPYSSRVFTSVPRLDLLPACETGIWMTRTPIGVRALGSILVLGFWSECRPGSPLMGRLLGLRQSEKPRATPCNFVMCSTMSRPHLGMLSCAHPRTRLSY